MKTKKCSRCKKEKSSSEFNVDNRAKSKLRSECNECRQKDSKVYNQKNKEIINQKKIRYRRENKEILRKKYKIFKQKFPWYGSYKHAKERCNNPNDNRYYCYGARGIKFELSKKDFIFLWERDKAYLMKYPSIDRIDNNGNYCLENCRFIEKNKNLPHNYNKKINE